MFAKTDIEFGYLDVVELLNGSFRIEFASLCWGWGGK
jgi:hypothetical protein